MSAAATLPPATRALHNGLWNVARVLVSLPIFLFFTRFLYETLGDESRGAWALVGAFWLQPALFDLGIGEALTRAVARRRRASAPERASAILAGLAILLVLLCLLAAVYWAARSSLVGLVTAGSTLAVTDVTLAFDLGALAFALSLIGSGLLKVIQGFERYDLASAFHITTVLCYAGFGVGRLRQAPQIASLGEAAVLAAAVGLGCAALAVLGLSRRVLPADTAPAAAAPAPAAVPSVWRELLGFGPVMYLSSLSGLVEGVAGKYLLAGITSGGATLAGYLDNATEVVARLRTLPHLLAAPVFPAAAAAATPADVGTLYRSASRRNILTATPLLIGGVAFAEPFVKLWLGDGGGDMRLQATTLALCVLSVGSLFQVLYLPAYNLTAGRGRPWPATMASLASAAVNLSLAVMLVRGHGVRGIVFATAAGHIVACVGFLWWFHRSEGLSLGRTLLEEVHPPLSAMIAAAGLGTIALDRVGLGWQSFLAFTSSSVALYGVLLWAIGHFRNSAAPDAREAP